MVIFANNGKAGVSAAVPGQVLGAAARYDREYAKPREVDGIVEGNSGDIVARAA